MTHRRGSHPGLFAWGGFLPVKNREFFLVFLEMPSDGRDCVVYW
ncbi:hypothetical protein HMPREF0262_02301 [Clostridium sp. ATCC 29733]|nr:hypothetical protein HMPREF0262_02301 [Clostridium sp. ATCC 29733]